jgi:hypothetical protein
VADVMYVLGTVLFFAAMLAYARGCEALGREQPGEEQEP